MSSEIISEIAYLITRPYDAYDCATMISEGDWTAGKYERRTDIIQYKGHYIQIDWCRSGSYFSDYDYMNPKFTLVERVEETRIVEVWKPIQL